MAFANIVILSAQSSSQHQLSSQTGARFARHSLRPHIRRYYIVTKRLGHLRLVLIFGKSKTFQEHSSMLNPLDTAP